MATYYAQASGNWSDISWNTAADGSGVNGTPGSADTANSNGKTVTVNGNYTVAVVTGSTGTFLLANGVTLTCTANPGITFSGGNTSPYVVTFDLPHPNSATVVANLNNHWRCIENKNSGTLNIVGNIIGGSVSAEYDTVINSSSGAINVNGNVTGGGTSLSSSWANSGVRNIGPGAISISGNVSAGLNRYGNYSHGAINSSSGALNIAGNIEGSESESSNSYGVLASGSGSVSVIGSIRGGRRLGSVSRSAGNLFLTGPFLLNIGTGIMPISSSIWLWLQSNQYPTYMQVQTETSLVIRPLYTADYVGGNPAVADVRAGVAFGPINELTGTMAVPSADSVGAGVPVDHTVGTQTVSINPADFWDVLASSLTAAGSIGARLKNCSTPASTAAQIASLV